MRVKQLRSGNLREGSTLGVPRRGQWCLNPRVDQDGKDMQGRRGRGEGWLLRVNECTCGTWRYCLYVGGRHCSCATLCEWKKSSEA